jgi:hypothetical protein
VRRDGVTAGLTCKPRNAEAASLTRLVARGSNRAWLVAAWSRETTGNAERGVSVVASLFVPENNVCASHVENGAENGSRINATSQTAHSLDSIDAS